jgi:uracil-DNA glycosylase
MRVSPLRKLELVHAELDACRACPGMVGPVVHGPAVDSRVLLVGQAPGPHEGHLGRPFAWTAGKTLFRWLESALGVGEEELRRKIYMSAVARCFPGKAKNGGDRKPDADEIQRCRRFLEAETSILRPSVVLAVGGLAIREVLGHEGPLADVVGTVRRARYHGVATDVIALPHPSGASTWHRTEPGRTLLQRALASVAVHPEVRRAIA